MMENIMVVRIKERGYAGHFCASQSCSFRRNTLIEYGDKRIVVSTVGNYRSALNGEIDEIGCDRHYETMAFEAIFQYPYWEADIGKNVYIDAPCSLKGVEHDSDFKADEMHDAAVKELAYKISV